MNFSMKILEKLNLWEFEDRIMKLAPLQDEQYGFRKALSTESCLTATYEKVGLGIIQELFTVAVYCDIEGAETSNGGTVPPDLVIFDKFAGKTIFRGNFWGLYLFCHPKLS